MDSDFDQIRWDRAVEEDLRALLKVAIGEDIGGRGDCTSLAVVAADRADQAAIVARQSGVIAGLPAVPCVLAEIDPQLRFWADMEDGQGLDRGVRIGTIRGPTRSILSAERLVLNLLGRLAGIATLTRQYVEVVSGTGARIYDTRKTTPGWRRLEKYAVRCGGGTNHRTGLFDAVLIKDNHLAALAQSTRAGQGITPAQAVDLARRYARGLAVEPGPASMIVQIEVDSLEQLFEVLPSGPDIVLLDNMTPEQLRQAVAHRDAAAPGVALEASGGVSLKTVRAIAQTGIDRISVGALTHSAAWLDLGLDWLGTADADT